MRYVVSDVKADYAQMLRPLTARMILEKEM